MNTCQKCWNLRGKNESLCQDCKRKEQKEKLQKMIDKLENKNKCTLSRVKKIN